MPDQPRPSVLAVLLCDQIVVDRDSNKHSLIGVFDTLNVERPPALHQQLGFYARMTDAEGTYVFRLSVAYISGDVEKELAVIKIEMTIPDRLKAFDLAINLPPASFPFLGRYEFRLSHDGLVLGHATMDVVERAA